MPIFGTGMPGGINGTPTTIGGVQIGQPAGASAGPFGINNWMVQPTQTVAKPAPAQAQAFNSYQETPQVYNAVYNTIGNIMGAASAPQLTPTTVGNTFGSKGAGSATTPTNQPVGYQATPQVYQQSYAQPTYNPMGGNTGMTGGNMYSQPTFSQGYNNPQGPQAIQQPMYQNYGYQQQQPYQQQPQGGFQQQPMGGGKGGAQAQPAPQPAPTTSSAPGQKGAGSATPAPQPAPTTSSAPGQKGVSADVQPYVQAMANNASTTSAPMTGNTSTYDPATQTYTTAPSQGIQGVSSLLSGLPMGGMM